jgi:hypothetical protein
LSRFCHGALEAGPATPSAASRANQTLERRAQSSSSPAQLERRVTRVAPLFSDEFIAREIAARPAYFQGKSQT